MQCVHAQVRWHRSLDTVAAGDDSPALYIAHEFFDALPVHQVSHCWRAPCFHASMHASWQSACCRGAVHSSSMLITLWDCQPACCMPRGSGNCLTPQLNPKYARRQFQCTERGWRERLVDLAPDQDARHLALVLAPRDTPASRLLLPRRLAQLPPGAGSFPLSSPHACHRLCQNAHWTLPKSLFWRCSRACT
jgi:hypothetical protein